MIDIENFIKKIEEGSFLTFIDLIIKDSSNLEQNKKKLLEQIKKEKWLAHIENSLVFLNNLLEDDGKCFLPKDLIKGRVCVCSKSLENEYIIKLLNNGEYIEINKNNIEKHKNYLLNALEVNFSYAPELNISLFDNKNDLINDYALTHLYFSAIIREYDDVVKIIGKLNKKISIVESTDILEQIEKCDDVNFNYVAANTYEFHDLNKIDIYKKDNNRSLWGNDSTNISKFLLNNYIAKNFYGKKDFQDENKDLDIFLNSIWKLIFKSNFNKNNVYLMSIIDRLPEKIKDIMSDKTIDIEKKIKMQDIILIFEGSDKKIIEENNANLLLEIEKIKPNKIGELLHIINKGSLFFTGKKEEILNSNIVKNYLNDAIIFSDDKIIVENIYLEMKHPCFPIQILHKKLFDQNEIRTEFISNEKKNKEVFIIENKFKNVTNEFLWEVLENLFKDYAPKDLAFEIDLKYVQDLKNNFEKHMRELKLSALMEDGESKNKIKINKGKI